MSPIIWAAPGERVNLVRKLSLFIKKPSYYFKVHEEMLFELDVEVVKCSKKPMASETEQKSHARVEGKASRCRGQ